MLKHITLFLFLIFSVFAQAQSIKGQVFDEQTGDPVIGANVVVKGTTNGTSTDLNGYFTLIIKDLEFPIELEVSFIGLLTRTFTVEKPSQELKFELTEDAEMLGEVSIIEQRLSEQQRKSALTVEAMDAIAIKETPSLSFYEGLGNLKGVDLTSASIGFKIINTRGFNSTSPVRSLQLIDGVDNQAPGLNFSLGNFLGASELDIQNVDIIAGASSAFYGPNAFNGVIAMTTKDPFLHKGLSVSLKLGERRYTETAVRYAEAFKLGGKEYENFAFKLNVYYLTADDWEADNLDPTDQSTEGLDNPGGYDAINRYGDEVKFDDGEDVKNFPGLGNYYRTGIEEKYLVDYDTRNLKLAGSIHYKFKEDIELQYGVNFGYGTTVYQGDNRFSLKDITFLQNKIELSKKDKWFVRAYSTNENAGNSYDAYFTALRMQRAVGTDKAWGQEYRSLWSVYPARTIKGLDGYPDDSLNGDEFRNQLEPILNANVDLLNDLHDTTRFTTNLSQSLSNGVPLDILTPGTASYDSLFNFITTTSFNEGGSKFIDRSALYHFQGQYAFEEFSWGKLTLGGNYRLYVPNSEGTIFSDTGMTTIRNWEVGSYVGWEKAFYGDRLKLGVTVRVDKNQNFNVLSSQAFSMVYQIDRLSTLRLSVSSAIRNPTLQDQYLYYNVGRALLLGNLNGYDSLVEVADLENFLESNNQDRTNYEFDYFSVNPVSPERVRTAEIGYRTTFFDALFVDANYYYSWYDDFIGYIVGLSINDDPSLGGLQRFRGARAYRIAANATDQVTTQGFSVGATYYFWDKYSLGGNYTWNVLNTQTDDPIVPAFNTPEHKYNLTFSGRDLSVFKADGFGFNVTYKWIEGFIFEGSPQFTGAIDSYSLLDAQVSKTIEKWNVSLKLGSSNILNNQVFQVYGGPRVGRLAYFSILFELN